jgi:hypothetical protein
MTDLRNMTVQFDEASARWRVINRDGSVIEDGFPTSVAAWKWVDDHSEDDRSDAVTHNRISNAIRKW